MDFIRPFNSRGTTLKVLLAEHDAPLGNSVLHRLGQLDIAVEWVRSASELNAWATLLHRECQVDPAQPSALAPSLVFLDWELPGAATGEPLGILKTVLPSATIVVLSEALSGDDAAVLLSRGVPSIPKPVQPCVLSKLAADLATDSLAMPSNATAFGNLVVSFAASRRLSKQQALVLSLYLNGKSDKEIADLCTCSGATVYEHWRRMARKSGGRQKCDIIADFHRYLSDAPTGAISRMRAL